MRRGSEEAAGLGYSRQSERAVWLECREMGVDWRGTRGSHGGSLHTVEGNVNFLPAFYGKALGTSEQFHSGLLCEK